MIGEEGNAIRHRPALNSHADLPLRQVTLLNTWPPLSSDTLGWMELERDEAYYLIPRHQIQNYLQSAVHFGEKAAETYSYEGDLAYWINQVLESGATLRFKEKKDDQSFGWVRAQYFRKPPVIEIYRSSMDQLIRFFHLSGAQVSEDDVIALHLFHEWFHHLEVTQIGRTDHHLPRVIKKSWGPFATKQTVSNLREIAAHAFTQKVMKLHWSPLWLDHLILLSEKGWSKSRIREHFHHMNQRYRQLTEPIAEKV